MRWLVCALGALCGASLIGWLLRQRERGSQVSREWLRLQQQGEQTHYEGVCWEWPVRRD